MRRRVIQIDLLKGLAIIGVMAQHAFMPRVLYDAWDSLHVGQAVPIFFVLMGLNAGRSLERSGARELRSLYSLRYLMGRLDRLLVPFLVIWPVAAAAAWVSGLLHVGPLVLLGVLPLRTSPGNYFVTILFEFALVFPLAYWGLRRAPLLTTFLLVGLDVAFDLIAPHVSALTSSTSGQYLYDATLVKYDVVLLAGFWLGHVRITRRLLAYLSPLAFLAGGYLVALHLEPGSFNWLIPSFSRSTNFISAPYAIWLTCVGLLLLPDASRNLLTTGLAALGRASYHIFLVQMVWFGVLGNSRWYGAVGGMLAAGILGYAYYRLLKGANLGSRRLLGLWPSATRTPLPSRRTLP